MSPAGLSLADLRCVEFQLEGAAIRRELLPCEDVEGFVTATLRLHHEPGLNPHNGRPAARLIRLAVGEARLEEGPWWTSPSLEDDAGRSRLVRWRWDVRFDATEVDPPDPV